MGLRALRSFVRGRMLPVLFVLAGCATLGVGGPTDPNPVPTHERYLTVFLIDGVAHDVFLDQLSRGHLPHIAGLIEEGTYVERGITSFPSVSGFAHYPLLTGEAATRSGIHGLRWFDRSRTEGNFRNYIGRTRPHIDRDLSPHAPTYFEQFPNDPSVAFNSILLRGVGRETTLGMDFFLSKYRGEDWRVGTLNAAVQAFNVIPKFGSAEDVATTPRDVERKVMTKAIEGMEDGDRVQFIVLTTLDNMNHLEGYRTDEGVRPEYIAQMRLIDQLIGDYRRASLSSGSEERRVYLVASDHGVNRITRNISVTGALADAHGMVGHRDRAVRTGGSLDRPLSDYVERDIDVVEALQGNNQSYLYFRNPRLEGEASWHAPPSYGELRAYPVRNGADTVDLVRAVVDVSGVDLVVHSGPESGVTRIVTDSGASEIRTVGEGIFSYHLVSGEDPLRYTAELRDRARGEDEWLRLTHDRHFPYAVPLLARIRAVHPGADLVVVAEDGVDLGLDFEFIVGNYEGGHGGLDEGQMVVPLIVKGPGVRAGLRLPYARTEDVASTVQRLLGVAPGRPERVISEMLTGGGG